jgi:hypothetical protein
MQLWSEPHGQAGTRVVLGPQEMPQPRSVARCRRIRKPRIYSPLNYLTNDKGRAMAEGESGAAASSAACDERRFAPGQLVSVKDYGRAHVIEVGYVLKSSWPRLLPTDETLGKLAWGCRVWG